MKKIDFEWYLTQQVHAAITRLCEFFENAKISECLGKELIKLKKFIILLLLVQYII